MSVRGKYLVELAISKTRETTEVSLKNEKQIQSNENTQNLDDENSLLLLKTALSHNCIFEDEITIYNTNTDGSSLQSITEVTTEDNDILETEIEESSPSWSPHDQQTGSRETDSDVDSEPGVLDVTDKQSNQKNENLTNNLDTDKQNKRKRKCDSNKWIRNERKRKRNRGEEYVSSRKKNVSKRKMLEPCKESCIFKCSEKIDQQDRLCIFKKFWDLGNLQNQRNYILNCMTTISSTISTANNNSRRQNNHAFYFTLNDVKVRVCKVFFVHTLGVSERTIRTVISKTKDGFLEEDRRGKHSHHKIVDVSIKQGVRDHINSIPRVESHYLRAQTTREYIDGGKTLSDIHRDYVNNCKQQNKPFANYTMFSRIFRSEFNISFFVPKKDQCGICEQYNNSNENEKKVLLNNYNKHLKEKELSRLEKEKDKQQAKSNACIAVCFDLQAVLQTPCGEVSSFYYKSKLSTYNFTIFDLGSLQGHCFIWHEGEGNRGANEIGTCLFKFLQSSAKNVPIVLYCDNCCGQNKNKFITCLLLYAVMTLNIPLIELKFLVVGHTQNEGDNMHSLIEKQKKRSLKSGPIYIPAQWTPIIANAKKSGKPFQINEMDYNNFYDLKALQESMGNNFTLNVHGEKVIWHDIVALKVSKKEPLCVFYKNSYEDVYKKIDICKKRRTSANCNMVFKQAYSTPIKISQTKLDALGDLCSKNHIKPKYHGFYQSLGCKIETSKNNSKKPSNK